MNEQSIKNYAKELGMKGGRASAKKRFDGKTKDEISEIMRKVRLTKLQKKEFDKGVNGMVANLNKNVLKKN